jgi:hypothetical protein
VVPQRFRERAVITRLDRLGQLRVYLDVARDDLACVRPDELGTDKRAAQQRDDRLVHAGQHRHPGGSRDRAVEP